MNDRHPDQTITTIRKTTLRSRRDSNSNAVTLGEVREVVERAQRYPDDATFKLIPGSLSMTIEAQFTEISGEVEEG